MSMDRCNDCSRLVDTNSDCGAYCQQLADGTEQQLNFCRCEWCRDDAYEASELELATIETNDMFAETGTNLTATVIDKHIAVTALNNCDAMCADARLKIAGSHV